MRRVIKRREVESPIRTRARLRRDQSAGRNETRGSHARKRRNEMQVSAAAIDVATDTEPSATRFMYNSLNVEELKTFRYSS